MKIQVVSDLHLEFSNMVIPNNNSDVLILSGDILIANDLYRNPVGTISADRFSRNKFALLFREFLTQVSNDFPAVIYVAGNHEFYHGKWNQTINILKEECSKFSNIFYLEKSSHTINDVTFLGATLWTDMNNKDPYTCNAIRHLMNDFRTISDETKGYISLSPETTVLRHMDTLSYFQSQLDANPLHKFVVVSHHAPSKLSIADIYNTPEHYLSNGGYHSDLTAFIEKNPQICLWTHGHTHTVFDYKIGNTRVVCNPRGYNGYEDTHWDPNTIFEI